jgi:hypothetical protein
VQRDAPLLIVVSDRQIRPGPAAAFQHTVILSGKSDGDRGD